jgi:hypothetical protein
MVLLLLAIGRLVPALAIQKNTREVADHFKWLRNGKRRKASREEAASRNAQVLDDPKEPRRIGVGRGLGYHGDGVLINSSALSHCTAYRPIGSIRRVLGC